MLMFHLVRTTSHLARTPFDGNPGPIAQRESVRLTRGRSLVRNQLGPLYMCRSKPYFAERGCFAQYTRNSCDEIETSREQAKSPPTTSNMVYVTLGSLWCGARVVGSPSRDARRLGSVAQRIRCMALSMSSIAMRIWPLKR